MSFQLLAELPDQSPGCGQLVPFVIDLSELWRLGLAPLASDTTPPRGLHERCHGCRGTLAWWGGRG